VDPDAARALGVTVALAPWWNLRGRLQEGSDRLADALAATPDAPPEQRAKAHLAMARLWSILKGAAFEEKQARAALELLAPLGDTRLAVRALGELSAALRNQRGCLDAARATAREAIAMAGRVDDHVGLAVAQVTLGMALLYGGDFEVAAQLAAEALRVSLPATTSRFATALLCASQHNQHELDAAEEAGRRGLAASRAAGDLRLTCWYLSELGNIAVDGGRWLEAIDLAQASIEVALQIGDQFKIIEGLETLATTTERTGRPADGARMFGAAARHSETIGVPDVEYTRQLQSDLRSSFMAALGAERFEAAYREGFNGGLDPALDLARSLRSHGTSPQGPKGVLSRREQDVVALVAAGLTDIQIGERLYISVRTVRSHLDRIRNKTGARRRAELTRLASQLGLEDQHAR
jgi:DNA-binding CsgD family transcriptional regulator/tetratricopeptide (TPR) repeat protein